MMQQSASPLSLCKSAARPSAVPALKTMQARRGVPWGCPADSARSMASSSPYASLTHNTLASAAPRLADKTSDLPGKQPTTSPVAAAEKPVAESPYVNLQSASGAANDPKIPTAAPGPPSASCTPASGTSASSTTASTADASPHTSTESSRDSGGTVSSGTASSGSSSSRPGAGAAGQQSQVRAASKPENKQRLNVSPFSLAPARPQGGNAFASSGDAFGKSAFSGGGGDFSFNNPPMQPESNTDFTSSSGCSSGGSTAGGWTAGRSTAGSTGGLASTSASSSNATSSNVCSSFGGRCYTMYSRCLQLYMLAVSWVASAYSACQLCSVSIYLLNKFFADGTFSAVGCC